MAKQPPQQPEEAQPHLHPVLRGLGRVDERMARRTSLKEKQDFQIEELEQWKTAVNGLASTSNGKMFLTNMVKFSQLSVPRGMNETLQMVEDKLRAAFYLTWVRPFLKPELRREIE